MDLRELRTFRAVVKHLSFNRAADELCYVQSTVSAQIQALEEDLGVRLFDRLGRKVLLTEAGARLLHYADKMLDLAEETRSEVAGDSRARGSLTVRIPETLGVYRLPSAIQRFRGQCPEVRLHFTTCAHEGLAEDLRRGVTDLAFLITDAFSAPDLEVERVGTERLVLAVPLGHRLASRSAVGPGDLEGETVLLSRVDCSYRKGFERCLAQAGVRLGTRLEFQSVAAIKQCVGAGIGVTIIPAVAVAAEVRAGRLAAVPWGEEPQDAVTFMIRHRDKWVSPSLRTFMATARAALAEGSGG